MEKSAKGPTEDVQGIFEDVIVQNLSTPKGISEGELLELITKDLEQQFSDQFEDLLEEGRIEYLPTKGRLVKQ
ncbi:hypothetical protein CP556_21960 [Natrinema sp. CBA1119]|uniref:DUF5805 domain-containing protein n=1 Tax=Natrinema sp. CBA1119 TaxID=1608465 RepID=UPI000BF61FED|nr:DUF5805 domain-containing protein [Natrinema sp. CBA1119]PGF14351.1 hypothetical protein CP556_21870 [Natrinema sp. CBA1119]PGF14360.1 hypothetical protein CP556_21960 [Natrinema sp. CBA1119]